MSRQLAFYAFEPGAPGVPAASATGVFVRSLANLLASATPGIDLQVRWLRPAGRGTGRRLARWGAAAGWMAGELVRLLGDPADDLLFIYPKLPIMAHVGQPVMLGLAIWAYRALAMKARLRRRRILVIVEDLPVEMAEGRATAGGPPVELDVKRLRAIETVIFRAADRLIVPEGFVVPIRDRHPVDPDRIRTFRRNIYLPAEPEGAPAIDFDDGAVNFFYSGSVDAHVAANFREILRSIRNAPQTRLHVCGPGREAVEEWLHELAVPNVTHYGQVAIDVHDWLARRCDVGLILYPTDNPYNHLTPTMKYSAYLANGLAVLSTDLRCVAENVRKDGVGQTMPIAELALELMRWATRPQLWESAKARAETEAAVVRSGVEMKSWIDELAAESGSVE
ncbi:MAG: glycosyltransferase family 4 protein [Gemmatimonadetes bacterium]|uniref:Glycosyltransferase family 4 protein n=1 Tax=Candidatus Kutchimonas denitrificans TaxID=3056748 RepID=A0AAE4Z4U8_9BACT|nr:glycosyltransferase family 4 protein [Gemmatimonadota bacterium]NIR73824.1 glycosyltransferase family 4 protein [Candidatus Kutchimonas denitrificans]NIS00097.1 glycosyltransferase family 4 protein [Gemmatimonadota bacterium]NIT65686.1 glycosyltransferase family 4 protein [Gemmatimonadota bacterium]NIU53134.1 hypothetical protein [Gemmatimonadota bacterium]